MSSVRTLKYKIYHGGQVYTLKGEYLRDLTEEQYAFVMHTRWLTKTQKKRLDEIIDGGDGAFEIAMERNKADGLPLKEAMEKAGFKMPEEPEIPLPPHTEVNTAPIPTGTCFHRFFLLEKIKNNTFLVCCRTCLATEVVQYHEVTEPL